MAETTNIADQAADAAQKGAKTAFNWAADKLKTPAGWLTLGSTVAALGTGVWALNGVLTMAPNSFFAPTLLS